MINRAGHLLLLLVVHLSVNVAATRELSEKQQGKGILSPKPRTVGFVDFLKHGHVLHTHLNHFSNSFSLQIILKLKSKF